jgi:hypothetical protein
MSLKIALNNKVLHPKEKAYLELSSCLFESNVIAWNDIVNCSLKIWDTPIVLLEEV